MITNEENIDDSSNVFSSLNNVLDTILAAFKIPEKPVTPLPPPLLLVGANLRTGISPSTVASRIISRQSEAGMVVGDVFGDGPNTTESMYVIMIEEIINAIHTESKVEVVIPPGVGVMTIGVGNMGAPVVSQGATTTIAVGSGVIR